MKEAARPFANRVYSAAYGFGAGALVLVGTGFYIRAIQEMGPVLALLLVILALPGSLVSALVNPRHQIFSCVVGAATSGAIVIAILGAVVSRI